MASSPFTVVLSAFVARTPEGNIDHQATTNKFASLLQRYEAERETENEELVHAINAVFDDHPGTRMNSPYVLNQALLVKMGCQPSELPILTKRGKEYLQSNTGERGQAIFGMVRGPGGGCVRWSDVPEEKKEETAKK